LQILIYKGTEFFAGIQNQRAKTKTLLLSILGFKSFEILPYEKFFSMEIFAVGQVKELSFINVHI